VRGFPGAVVKGFDTYAAATRYIAEYCLLNQRQNEQIPQTPAVLRAHTNSKESTGISRAATVGQTKVRQRQNQLPYFTDPDCSPEQKEILALVKQGQNVFITGSAGVGKSFVVQKICQLFESRGLQRFSDFFVTASTGLGKFILF
jgi:Cdc6-like AAA superfamily ATPase